MSESDSWFLQELDARGVSRRDFVGFCSAMAAVLALPRSSASAIAAEIQKTEKPVLVWLEFQDCAGNTESFLRATRPTAAEIVLDTLSVDYHETIMAAAGHQAEEALTKTVKERSGAYIAVVEGSIPTGAKGAYCTIGGRSALQIAREVCGGAMATIAMGTCATFGGLPAAAPNPTGALGVGDAVPGVKNLINLSACPANVENLTALIVYFLTFKRWPPLDAWRRPLFAYGKAIHDNCERRAHFDAGQYVEAWGDEGHR
ncbi:MAG TPA: hydrogenase small subunit, partial [Vicinamibacteria bacterium]|nr:hydrogenase small subunit [Vicinamibacteria bacterium]